MARSTGLFVWLLLAVGICGCDQATKLGAVAGLTDTLAGTHGAGAVVGRLLESRHPRPSATIEIIEGLWRFHYAENPGAAFSFLARADSTSRLLLTLFRLLVLGTLIVWLRRSIRDGEASQRWRLLQPVGLTLCVGGAAGNLLDGLRLGYVVDFVQWHWYDRWYWPTFNVADSALVCGVTLLVVAGWLTARPRST